MSHNPLSLIDEKIRRLQDLRRIAEDPEMVDMMRLISNTNGYHPIEKAKSLKSTQGSDLTTSASKFSKKTDRVGLTKGVEQAVVKQVDVFTIHDVFRSLMENGIKIGAAKPLIGISGILQRLEKRGLIECIEKGKAGRPSHYRTLSASQSAP